MGYSTEFTGQLKFTRELNSSELAYLNEFFDENPDDHQEWLKPDINEYGYIDFKLIKDFSGIQHNGAEKSRNQVEAVNLIIANMKAKYPDFGLTGQILAQGEDYEDRWILKINDETGYAEELSNPIVGQKICCPHCERSFILEGEKC